MHIDLNDRRQWPRLLLAVPAAEVRALADTLSTGLAVEDLQLPQAGLGLLTLRDSALGERYFPGELPVARARVRVSDGAGAAEGAALVLDDRPSLARAIAVLDAVLAGRLAGHERIHPLLGAGAAGLARQQAERNAMLAATLVNFALLDSGEDDDE